METNDRLTVIEATLEANGYRLDKVEERLTEQEKLVTSVAVLANNMETLNESVSEMKGDVKALMSKSGKLFDSLMEKVLWLALGGALTYCVSSIIR